MPSAESSDLAAVVLAAGRGRRLRPLTDVRPKPLCPVANRPLIDLALDEVANLLGPLDPERLAVNVHHLAEQLIDHLDGSAQISAHISHEQPVALGTAGAIGALRGWLDGRAVLIRNTDVWRAGVVPSSFVDDWDGTRPRLLVVADPARADFAGGWRFAGLSLLPGAIAARVADTPAGLYEAVWRHAERDNRLELVPSSLVFIDCGTPTSYLHANLTASGGASVIGADAVVEGEVIRSVVWPHGTVHAGERLVEAIRVGADITVSGSV